MGRIITFDNIIQEKLNEILKEKYIHSGLIVGQCTEQKDIAIRLCPTPMKEDVNEEDDKEANKKKNKNIPSDLNLDEQWICQHAKQLLRLLPGGLDVLGLYIVSKSESSIKYQAQIRQILFAIYRILTKNRKFNMCSKERILLNICPVTFKMICKTYNISDIKSSANPADWKFQSVPNKFHRIRCQLAVDIKFPLRAEKANLSLQKQMEAGLRPFLDNVAMAYTLIDGQQRPGDQPLAVSHKSKKRHSEKEEISSEWHDAEVFFPLENNPISRLDIFDCVCMMTFKGTIHCRAYVHSKATVEEAINALKDDIMRSVVARCEIHCEDLLLIEEEQQDPLVVHELPRRVFAPLPQADVCVCDYQFHSDRASDSLEAFKELIGLELVEQDIDLSCEISPTTSTLILPEAMEDRLSDFGDTPTHKPKNTLIPIVGLVATVAVGVASFLIMSYDK